MHPHDKIHKKKQTKYEFESIFGNSLISSLVMFLKLKRRQGAQKSLGNIPDELLVTQYLESGNKELIAELFERYTHLVYGICLNYLQDPDQSKDAVMDIFESLFHKLAIHTISNFRNWLYSVVRNHCLMVLRKSGTAYRVKDKLRQDTADFEHADDLNENDDILKQKDLLGFAVEHLNHEQGICIRLMYIEDLSYRDIADRTGYSMNEVKSHIQNGKRNLKNYIINHNDHKA
jgi:RNA polymerase sigma factor (sigma-70 family)